MPTDFWFRFSTYLTLALACASLGYAEWELMPAVSVFAGLVIAFLVVSFLLDRRVELSLGKANLLGLVIGIGAALWMVYRATNPPSTGPMAQLGWPTTLLPLIAPVLMVLIPAKLLRPKHVGDWWAMHGVALAAVGLASAMTDTSVFIVLLVAYAVTAAWSMVLFFYRRCGGFVPPIPNRPVGPPPQVLNPDLSGRGPRWMFARSTVWLLLAGLIALPLFFTLPRPEGSPWLITKQPHLIGQSAEATIDLNGGGTLEATDEIAYTLFPLLQNGEMKNDLHPEQLWRARAFTEYQKGLWSEPTTVPALVIMEPRFTTSARASDFGPDGFLIEYHPGPKEVFPVLASPTWWQKGRMPVSWVNPTGSWRLRPNMSWLGNSLQRPLGRYLQVCGPPHPEQLGPPFEPSGRPSAGPLVRKLDSRTGHGRVVDEYATRLLDRLIAEGKLPAGAKLVNDARGRTAEEHHESIARLFASHLANSGTYGYTTTIARQDAKMDPIEDFLQNTRSGNCELFATALVMLLRAVDVPSQYVTGYKGWEIDENGDMVIRRRNAHAWAEVLVSRPPPQGFEFDADTPPERRTRVWHWLSLDPTSVETTVVEAEAKNWWERSSSFLFEFVIGYDKRKQQQAIQEGIGHVVRLGPFLLGGLIAVLALRGPFRRWTRALRRAAVDDTAVGPVWYDRYVRAVGGIGLTQGAGETPREFADRASTELHGHGVRAADVPPFVTSKLYRVRYAGDTLGPEEEAAVTAAVERLEQELRDTPPGRHGEGR